MGTPHSLGRRALLRCRPVFYFLLVAAAAFHGFSTYTQPYLKHAGIRDNQTYYLEAYKYLHGFGAQELMYGTALSQEASRHLFGFTFMRAYIYPPVFAQLLVPLVKAAGYERFALLWHIMNHAAFFLIIFFLLKCVGRCTLPGAAVLFSIAAFFFPFAENFFEGQINLLIVLLVTLYLFCSLRKKEVLGSVFLALGIVFKIYPAVFLLYCLVKRKYTTVACTAAMVCCLAGASVLMFGREPWIKYLCALFPRCTFFYPVVHNIGALSYIRLYATGAEIATVCTGLFLAFVCAVSAALLLRRTRSSSDELLNAAYMVTLFNIVSPEVFILHLVFLIVPVTLVLLSDVFKKMPLPCRILFVLTSVIVASGGAFFKPWCSKSTFMLAHCLNLLAFWLNLAAAHLAIHKAENTAALLLARKDDAHGSSTFFS